MTTRGRSAAPRARVTRILRRAVTASAVLLLAVAGRAGAGEIALLDGVPHVRNSAEPAEGTRRLVLEERWRVGGEDEEIFFGVITDAVADAQGNVYLLDRQLCQVFVHAPDGTLLREISRQGEGPGELQSPRALLFLPDSSLAIVHRPPGEVVRLDREGLPLPSLQFRSIAGEPLRNAMLRQVHARGGTLAATALERQRRGGEPQRTRFLSLFSADGTEQMRLLETDRSGFDFARRRYVERDEYFVDQGAWTVDARGWIYAAPERDRYRVSVYAPDGTLDHVIERVAYEARRRTAEEREEIGAGVTMSVHRRQVEVESEIEERDPCVARLEADARDRLWVLHSCSQHDQPAEVLRSYDVFGPEGHYQEVVEIVCEGDPQRDRLINLGQGRFVLVRGFQDAFQSLFPSGGEEDEEEEGEEPIELEIVYLEVAS